MKKMIVLAISYLWINVVFAQTGSCCAAPDNFAAFSGDIAFVNMHIDPLPFNFISEKGKLKKIKCGDGKEANIFEFKSKKKSNKYLIVVHEWWGLNGYIKDMSEKLYGDLDEKVTVIAIDLYDGRVAETKDSAGSYMKNLDPKRAESIMQAVIQNCGDNAQIATIGWCLGGGYALQTSILAKEKAVACVIYYGFPETDTVKLKQLEANVLMVWPNKDKWITVTVVDQFKADMLLLNKNLKVEEYTADHAFANPSNPKHNAEFAADAYAKSLTFINANFNEK